MHNKTICETRVIFERLSVISLLLLAGLSSTDANQWVLYDGTTQAVTPDQFEPQSLFYFSIGGSQSYDPQIQATNFDTSAANSAQGGYSSHVGDFPVNPDLPELNRQQAGYSINFSVEIESEQHANDVRSGFSIIAISSDVSPGVPSSIELGFQDGRVFSQNDNPLFGSPPAEESTFDPVGVGFVDYQLQIQGDQYTLLADGQVILGGMLRDYTAFGGTPDVYETPNFLFFGDDTTSAKANINLRFVSIEIPKTTTTTASSVNVFRGVLIGGELSDTFSSDDSRMLFNPGLTINSSEAPVWLIFDGTLPTSSPGSLNLVVEAQAGTPGLTATLEAWNWQTVGYDVVDSTAGSFNNDTVVIADLTSSIGHYVQAGTGSVRARLGWRKTGLTINFPWEVRLDQIVWQSN